MDTSGRELAHGLLRVHSRRAVDSMERRLRRCQSLARNAPFRKIAVKAFTSKQTANERAAKKGLAATGTLPVG